MEEARRLEREINGKFEEFKQHIKGGATMGDVITVADPSPNSVEGRAAVGQSNVDKTTRRPPELEADVR